MWKYYTVLSEIFQYHAKSVIIKEIDCRKNETQTNFSLMNQMFFELTSILIVAGVIAYVLHFLKQPSIIAYILTGLLIGPFALYNLHNPEILHGLSEVGITLLLFMVGLDLDFSQLKRIGKTAITAGVAQIIATFVLAYAITTFLGFEMIAGVYIGLALTFSSTIIVVKLLSEKKDMQSLHGKLALGILLLQDISAIIILILMASLNSSDASIFPQMGAFGNIILAMGKAFMIGIVVTALSRMVFPKLLQNLVKSDELTLLFSLGWSLGLAALFSSPLIGFNAAIGGFVAGLALANTGAHYQISGKIKPLRDFFIIIFFIVMGSQVVFDNIGQALIPAIILTAFVLIIKPLVVMVILSLFGYKMRISFKTGTALAQVSEFSLILMALALTAGHITQLASTIVALVGIASIALSSYGVIFANQLYAILIHPFAVRFESRTLQIEKGLSDVVFKRHIVIVGAHRLGAHMVHTLLKQKEKLIVVDFNPDVIEHYTEHGIPAVCGDIADPYIQEVANLSDARMIICTIPDFHDTLALIEAVRGNNKRPKLIVAASDEEEALELYDKGAGYVLLPHFVGGMHLVHIVEQSADNRSLTKLKERHLKALQRALKVD